jgi:hypothetical protein
MRSDIPLTKRLRMDFMVNTDVEYMVGLKYIINKHLGAKIHYDSDMGFSWQNSLVNHNYSFDFGNQCVRQKRSFLLLSKYPIFLLAANYLSHGCINNYIFA